MTNTILELSKMRKDAGRSPITLTIAETLKSNLLLHSQATGWSRSMIVEIAVYEYLEKFAEKQVKASEAKEKPQRTRFKICNDCTSTADWEDHRCQSCGSTNLSAL